jgi:hypothetical protein
MFSIPAVGWIPVPPVVTLYLALIFTAVWLAKRRMHGTEESPPSGRSSTSKSQGARRACFGLDWRPNKLDDDRPDAAACTL